ncbi:MAG: glycosyltransferase [Myxococcales bacterium]|nr:MAG: glycosyltransferase [Myxococcales bacterium]
MAADLVGKQVQVNDTKARVMLSVIVPMYNAESFVQERMTALVQFLKSEPLAFEVIVVDDASTDKSVACIESLPFAEIGIRRNEQNQGKFASIARGMAAASGELRMFTDADCSCDFSNLKTMLELLKTSGADIVVGDRHWPSSNYITRMPLFRRLVSKCFAKVVDLVLGMELGDTQCGLKAMRAETSDAIFPLMHENRFEGDVELLLLARCLGFQLQRMPVDLAFQGPSTVRLFRDGLSMFRGVFRIRRRWLRHLRPLLKTECPPGLGFDHPSIS